MVATQTLDSEALTTFNTLLYHLQEEANLFERLAELMATEQDVLRTLRAPGLSELNGEKEQLIALIDQIAEVRAGSLEEFADQLGVSQEIPSLAGILDHLPPLEHRCLNDARHRLLRVAQMVRQRGGVSQRLLEVSVDTIHGILGLLQKESGEKAEVYGGEGAVTAQKANGTVFQHTV